MNLLLLSNSTTKAGYLAHALDAIVGWAGDRRRAVFVPFAGVTREWAAYTALVQDALRPAGIDVTAVPDGTDAVGAVREAQLILVGGGNTFHLLHHCRRLALLGPIADAVRKGTPYAGWSAGSNLACPTICTTNDMPIVDPKGFDALGLVDFQINPHYTNALPAGLQGETRNQRLAEFARVRPDLPVLGLPEGNWVRADAGQAVLHGPNTAWWFAAGREPQALAAGPLPSGSAA